MMHTHPIPTVCRHLGYCAHPQNELPTFAPFFAVRSIMGTLHFGHTGGFGLVTPISVIEATGRSTADFPSRSNPSNAFPSINSIFRPAANAFASFVNDPDVTTYPPATCSAAMTPYNSRTTDTPTCCARHCLH